MSLAWSDERYVRLYTRDTPHWLLGPWEARAVLGPVLRKVDRAGMLDLGDDGLEALAVVVGLPLEVVETGMAWWLRKGTFELVGGYLVMPLYQEAQEATASDAQRAREHRARSRDRARAGAPTITDGDPSVTNRDGAITARDASVTTSHAASHGVTPSCAVPPVPSHAEPQREQLALEGSPPADSAESATRSEVRAVFEHWTERQSTLTRVSRARLKLTRERKTRIEARLRDGYSVADLHRAIDGMFATPHNVDNHFTDVELACRDSIHVDRYMAGPPRDLRGAAPTKLNGNSVRAVRPVAAAGRDWKVGDGQ